MGSNIYFTKNIQKNDIERIKIQDTSQLEATNSSNNGYQIVFKDDPNDKLNRKELLNLISNNIEDFFGEKRYDYDGNIFLLDGERGAGKTRILNKLKEQIKRYKIAKILNYSAWQFLDEKELFLDFRLSLELEYSLTTTNVNIKKFIKLGDKLSNVIDTVGTTAENYAKGIQIFRTGVDFIIKHGNKLLENKICQEIPYAGKRIKFLNVIAKGENSKDIDKILRKMKEKSEYEKKMEDFMSVKKRFEGEPKKTIIILDDLDRVEEKKLWRILSILSTFDSKSSKLLFILSGSSTYLKNIIDPIYHVSGEGENFLAKFITNRFRLSPFTKSLIKPRIMEIVRDKYNIAIGKETEEHITRIMEYYFLPESISYRQYKTEILESLIKFKNIIIPILKKKKTYPKIIWLPLIIGILLNKSRFTLNCFSEIVNSCGTNTVFCRLCYHFALSIGNRLKDYDGNVDLLLKSEGALLKIYSYILLFQIGDDYKYTQDENLETVEPNRMNEFKEGINRAVETTTSDKSSLAKIHHYIYSEMRKIANIIDERSMPFDVNVYKGNFAEISLKLTTKAHIF